MYALDIDGKRIMTDEFMAPLIEQMRYAAQSSGFQTGVVYNTEGGGGFQVDGVDYSAEGINGIRDGVIQLRDAALSQNNFEWAVLLSHAIAQLGFLKEMVSS